MAVRAGDALVRCDLTVHGAGANVCRSRGIRRPVSPPATIYTGTGHPHDDKFGLTIGDRFEAYGDFPRVDHEGLATALERPLEAARHWRDPSDIIRRHLPAPSGGMTWRISPSR